MKKNKFIVFEGIDGSGKSSTAELLATVLNERGDKTFLIKSPIGDFVKSKKYVNNECGILSHYFFYLSGNIHTSDCVKELLTKGNVVCDRYFFSTQAYHIARGVSYLVNFDDLHLAKPDYLFYLVVTDEVIRRDRINKRQENAKGDEEVFSKGSLLEKIDVEFRSFSPHIIDNTYKVQNEVISEILNIISK